MESLSSRVLTPNTSAEFTELVPLDSSFYDHETSGKMSYIPNYSGGGGGGGGQAPPTTYTTVASGMMGQGQPPQHQNVHMLKRKMTLDLTNAKRARVFSVNTPGVIDVLSSPDVQMLKIPTPELDKLIMNTAPGTLQTPTSVFFPKNVTEEQEIYARGFENALKQLHDQDSVQSSVQDEGSSNASSYKDSKSGYVDFSNVVVKEEPQTVPDRTSDSYTDSDDSDGSSMVGGNNSILPVDMASQEKIKLERKRQRNRLAASKCRRKKLERIAKLEEKVKQLKNENVELANVLAKLRDGVQVLKSQVYEHVQAGCAIVVQGTNAFT